LQQIESSFENQEDRKEALDSVVERAIAAGPYCVEHYEEKAASYVDAFDTAEKEADAFVKAEQEREDKICDEKRAEKMAKKMVRVRAIYDLLDEYLGDCPRKELALDCVWKEHEWTQDPLRFNCKIVEDAMRHMISAPVSLSCLLVLLFDWQPLILNHDVVLF
jgi:hypothetical protein